MNEKVIVYSIRIAAWAFEAFFYAIEKNVMKMKQSMYGL